jgi:hypothetical protein
MVWNYTNSGSFESNHVTIEGTSRVFLTERIMAVFGYGRVSTAEQSADNQRLEIERAGYAVEYWFADTVSGKAHAAQRKQFSDILAKLRRKDTVIVSKLDRLAVCRTQPFEPR